MRYKFTFLSLLFLSLFSAINLLAQGWQWSKPGNFANADVGFSKIATDPNGNLYTIYSAVSIDVPGHFRPGYSASGNICIVSYDCHGNYRWSKMIENGTAFEIATDKLGGVYFSGFVRAETKPIKVDEDTIIGITNKDRIIGKYDTSGNFKWLRMPQPDTMRKTGPGYEYSEINMCAGANGGIRIIAFLRANVFCDGNYTVSDSIGALHIIGYDADGNFAAGFKVDISGFVRMDNMQWDGIYNKYYLIGGVSGKGQIGATTVEDKGLVLCKFDYTGKSEWVKTGTKAYPSSDYIHFEGIECDADGNVYASCIANAGGVFDGYTFVNDSGKGLISGILKYDKDGNRIWAVNSREGGGEGLVFAVSENTVAAYGPMYKSTFIRWAPGYEVGSSFKKNYYLDSFNVGSFFARMDARTGAMISLDSILGSRLWVANGYGDICANQKDGFYIVGRMNGSIKKMIVPSLDTITNNLSKGYADYLVKYGTNDCGALSIPRLNSNQFKDLKIYPNPGNDFITIEYDSPNSRINLYNIMGQLVRTEIIFAQKQNINVQDLSPGIFMIELVQIEGKKRYGKLVIK